MISNKEVGSVKRDINSTMWVMKFNMKAKSFALTLSEVVIHKTIDCHRANSIASAQTSRWKPHTSTFGTYSIWSFSRNGHKQQSKRETFSFDALKLLYLYFLFDLHDEDVDVANATEDEKKNTQQTIQRNAEKRSFYTNHTK